MLKFLIKSALSFRHLDPAQWRKLNCVRFSMNLPFLLVYFASWITLIHFVPKPRIFHLYPGAIFPIAFKLTEEKRQDLVVPILRTVQGGLVSNWYHWPLTLPPWVQIHGIPFFSNDLFEWFVLLWEGRVGNNAATISQMMNGHHHTGHHHTGNCPFTKSHGSVNEDHESCCRRPRLESHK